MLVPFFFVFFLWILQFGLKANSLYDDLYKNGRPKKKSDTFSTDSIYLVPISSRVDIPPIPRCIVGPDYQSCFTIAWVTYGDDQAKSDMANIIKNAR